MRQFMTVKTWPTYAATSVGANIVLSALLAFSGVDATQAVKLSTLLMVNVVATGLLWQAWRQTVISIAEFLGVGIVGAVVVGLCIALLLPASLIPISFWILTPLVAFLLVIIRREKIRPILRLEFDSVTLYSALVAIAVSLFLNRIQFTRYGLDNQADYTQYHPDLLFHQALTNAITQSGVGQNGLMSDWPIRYHWFSHAVASAFEQGTNPSSFVVLTRLLPIIAICSMAFLGATWSRMLTKQKWVPLVVALTLTTGKFVGDSAGVQVNWDSPSQTLSIPLLIFACFVTYLLCNHPSRWPSVAVLATISFVLVGLKDQHRICLLNSHVCPRDVRFVN